MGLYVVQEVKEDDLSFKISDPLLYFVSLSEAFVIIAIKIRTLGSFLEDARQSPCDNSLARHIFPTQEYKLSTNPDLSPSFLKCSGCRVINYCSNVYTLKSIRLQVLTLIYRLLKKQRASTTISTNVRLMMSSNAPTAVAQMKTSC
jgi:hypothetical protein